MVGKQTFDELLLFVFLFLFLTALKPLLLFSLLSLKKLNSNKYDILPQEMRTKGEKGKSWEEGEPSQLGGL